MDPPKVGLRPRTLQVTMVCDNATPPSSSSNQVPTGSTWSLNHDPEIPPTLPPRLSPGIPAYTSPQWSNNFPRAEDSSQQGWHSASPLPAAPSPSQSTDMAFSSNSYSFMPGASQEPVNTTWDSDPPYTSTWGVNYKPKNAQPRAPEPTSKPPLPVSRPYLLGRSGIPWHMTDSPSTTSHDRIKS